jgi:hypothetical protein
MAFFGSQILRPFVVCVPLRQQQIANFPFFSFFAQANGQRLSVIPNAPKNKKERHCPLRQGHIRHKEHISKKKKKTERPWHP